MGHDKGVVNGKAGWVGVSENNLLSNGRSAFSSE